MKWTPEPGKFFIVLFVLFLVCFLGGIIFENYLGYPSDLWFKNVIIVIIAALITDVWLKKK